jgi:hypothetical protein
MTVFTLQSLVLRGVSVVCDGQNVGLRLGAESQTIGTAPEVRINPRHPSSKRERGFMPAQWSDDHAEYDRMAAATAQGAGRSLRCDGVLSRSTAISGYSAVPSGRFKPQTFKTTNRLQATARRGWSRTRQAASTWAS